MPLPSSNDSKKARESISRRNFLKLAGTSGLMLGIGGLLPAFGVSLKKQAYASSGQSINEQSYTYVVYRRGLETIAQKYPGATYSDGGTNPIHSVNPEEVLELVLNDPGPLDDPNGIRTGPGHIYIRDGLYQLGSSFSGFDLRSYTTLTMGPQAVLRVPSGYSGHVFRLQSSQVGSVSNCTINGGFIEESDPPMRKWIGILLHAVNNGVHFNKFMNILISNAGTGIQLEALGDQSPPTEANRAWINGNSFESLTMWQNGVFIDFVMDGEYIPHKNGINRNNFVNLVCQSGPSTKHGIRNIKHIGNSFLNVNIWDIDIAGPRAIISNVDHDARGTMIISGIMTGQNFKDLGTNTRIIDELNTKI